jgi:hypothetical protein
MRDDRGAMDEAPLTRQDMMTGYEHPYRRWIPIAWQYERVPPVVAIAALASVGALVADSVGGRDPVLLYSTLLGASMVVMWTLWVTLNAALIIANRIRDWEASEDDLAAVRQRRPHAAEADPHLAHTEYAVAVGDFGELVTYRFRPLAASQTVPAQAQLIKGKPRYAADQVAETPYDAVDAARAAEQLAEAQQHAAALEREAIGRAARGLEDLREAEEIEWESKSTGAALRGITGQRD